MRYYAHAPSLTFIKKKIQTGSSEKTELLKGVDVAKVSIHKRNPINMMRITIDFKDVFFFISKMYIFNINFIAR